VGVWNQNFNFEDYYIQRPLRLLSKDPLIILNTVDLLGIPEKPLPRQINQLTDNGGPTLTQALLRDSLAIDFAHRITPPRFDFLFGCPTTDQRGFLRTDIFKCDTGAYEDGAVRPQ